jgi:tRNA threonylcarbamoyladenosine modification (KEOPS) complex Cgi121 subunit
MSDQSFLEKTTAAREKLGSVSIIGVESVKIEDVNATLAKISGIGSFQLMDASLILNEEHVRFACFEAIRSFESGENITGSLEMEILVRAACTSQISEAIGRLGVRMGTKQVVLVGLGAGEAENEMAVSLLRGEISSSVFGDNPGKRSRIAREYKLSEPLEKNLVEKIALMPTG